MLPFAVLDARAARVVGMTTYMTSTRRSSALEIGCTWYAQSACSARHVNTECKLLLLAHAFETLGVHRGRVPHRQASTTQSRRAIERLGAQLDGILRHHALRRDGTLRDTAVYSITAGEWPTVQGAPALAARQTALKPARARQPRDGMAERKAS